MPGYASVSPYALLRASMPTQGAAPTAYDLYSLAQSAPDASAMPDAPVAPERPRGGERTSNASAAPNASVAPNASAAPESDALPPRARIPAADIPAKRTHYIADIQSRHQAALKRASLTAPKG